MFQRSLRTPRQSDKSRLTYSSKPTKYRIIYKTKNGLFNDVQETKSQIITQQKMNATQSSFLSSSQNKILMLNKNDAISHSNEQIDMPKNKKQHLSFVPQFLPKINLPVIQQTLSQHQFQSQNPQQYELRNKSIDQIQKKVDQLIQLKLLKTSTGINQQTENIQQIQRIQKEICDIVQYLQTQAPTQTLDDSNKRIRILEKIMAENLTESDMAKKYFYKKMNNKKKKKIDINQYRTDVKSIKQKTRELLLRNAPNAIHYESLCQINYKPPQKQAYPEKKAKIQYKFKHQALPRSTYDRDYLTYGSLPKYKYKQYSTIVPKTTIGKKTSLYQDDYKVKVAQKINYKQLDCFKDKFKNLKIPLINESQNVTNQTISFNQSVSQVQRQKKQKQQRDIKNDKTLIKGQRIKVKSQPSEYNSHFIKLLNTENHSNFTGENTNLRSHIKDKNLYAMKYAYKASVHA